MKWATTQARLLESGPLPRPEVRVLAFGVHGGSNPQELEQIGLDVDDVLDFSANLNPYGPAPGVRAVLAHAVFDRYPDPHTCVLRRALADHLGVAPDCVLPGNGASELIWLVALAFLRPADRVLVLGPTYAEYARAARLMGASVTAWNARDLEQFAVDVANVLRFLKRSRLRLVFLCNPNNPTGATIAPDIIAAWAERHAETIFVVDEAYLAFAPGVASAQNIQAGNVLVIRSMTKDFGLAGLRLGYAVGSENMIGWLARAQPPWSVNGLAQAAGVAALGDIGHYRRALEALDSARVELAAGLTGLGLPPVPSSVPFFLVAVGDGATFRQDLLRRGLLVRDCASFGLPRYVRIATRRPEENARLLSAIRQVYRPEEATHAG